MGKKKSLYSLQDILNDALYMNSTEFSKRNSWYCPDMFRITFNAFSYRKKPLMVNLHFGISFIGKMAAVLDLTAILDLFLIYKTQSVVACTRKHPIHLEHLVIKYLWKRLIYLRFWLRMAVILNNALSITGKPFFISKQPQMLFGDHKAMIRCQDHHNYIKKRYLSLRFS